MNIASNSKKLLTNPTLVFSDSNDKKFLILPGCDNEDCWHILQAHRQLEMALQEAYRHRVEGSGQ